MTTFRCSADVIIDGFVSECGAEIEVNAQYINGRYSFRGGIKKHWVAEVPHRCPDGHGISREVRNQYHDDATAERRNQEFQVIHFNLGAMASALGNQPTSVKHADVDSLRPQHSSNEAA